MYACVTTTYTLHDRIVPEATEQLWDGICVLRVPALLVCPVFAIVKCECRVSESLLVSVSVCVNKRVSITGAW